MIDECIIVGGVIHVPVKDAKDKDGCGNCSLASQCIDDACNGNTVGYCWLYDRKQRVHFEVAKK